VIVQCAGVRGVALRTDLDVGVPALPDHLEHVVEFVHDELGEFRRLIRHVLQGEKLLRVNLALPNEVRIDVAKVACS
jgi:hypothetical protein